MNPGETEGNPNPAPRKPIADAVMLALLAAFINFQGIGWGLPSVTRNRLSFHGSKDYAVSPLPEGIVGDSSSHFPEIAEGRTALSDHYPPHYFNPLRSYHPDEYYVLKGIGNMHPERFDFDPKLYGWPGFTFYAVAAALKGAQTAGFLTVTRDLTFFFDNPGQMARFYLAGRFLTGLFSVAAVVMLYLAGRKGSGRTEGFLAALMFTVTPAVVVNAHYMTGDAIALFWATVLILLIMSWHERMDWKRYAALGIVCGVATGTKFHAATLLAPVGCLWLFRRDKLSAIPVVAFSVILGFAAASPYHLINASRAWNILTVELGQVSHSASILTKLRNAVFGPFELLQYGIGGSALLFALAAVLCRLRAGRLQDRALAAGVILMWLGLGQSGTPFCRHVLPLVPFLCLLMARALVDWDVPDAPASLKRLLPLAILAVVLAPAAYKSSGMLNLFRAENVRAGAGISIEEALPPGATIAVPNLPLQYDVPPLDFKRYNVVLTGWDFGRVESSNASYILLCERWREIYMPGVNPQFDAFWSSLYGQSRGPEAKWAVAARFELSPGLFSLRSVRDTWRDSATARFIGLSADNSRAPEDMQYVNPRMTLYARAR
ncbi:MAG TPA: glycosyltransferase family 39 protein [Candidatus Brocadiia bacterium]|nr:glycosyltransferase family 39 protein [Candidatus Brocadiia bacterium]